MKRKHVILASLLGVFSIYFCHAEGNGNSLEQSNTQKVKDLIIYKDADYFSAFPSVIKSGKNDYIVAFRRAPERRLFGESYSYHVDPNSYLVAVRSKDGETWTKDPELIYAHPFGGSQDPCLLKLRDGKILCASYAWAFLRPAGIEKLKQPCFNGGNGAIFFGGYLLRSLDNGKTWGNPVVAPHVKGEILNDVFGNPLPAYNRGALYEGKSGRIFWSVVVNDSVPVRKTSNHLLVSDDKGLTWQYSGLVATDDKIAFNETSMYETPKGDLIAFLRTADYEDQACIARSTDGGKTFKWKSMGFKGHPCHALRLPDNRVLLTYGYRHKPFGIRGRVLNEECTDYATAPEFILRDDGGNGDIGYTWSVCLDKNRVLVVYYFNKENGARYIAGTVLEIGK